MKFAELYVNMIMFILKNHTHMHDVCVCDGQKKGWKEGNSLWTVVTPLRVEPEGKSFYSRHMQYSLNFPPSIFLLLFFKQENNKRLTPQSRSKNRARLNSSGQSGVLPD